MDESPQWHPKLPEGGVGEPRPPVVLRVRSRDLDRRAAQVGKAAGTAVALLRDIRRRLSEPGPEAGRDRLSALGDIARNRTSEFRQKAADTAENWRRAAQEASANLGDKAKSRFINVRERAQRTGHDYPVHVGIAAGVAGLLVGAGIRIRRSHRAG